MRRGRHSDPVTPELRAAVLARDGQCVASILDPEHECRGIWGEPIPSNALAFLTLDHVQSEYGRMGQRAESDMTHLVSLCPGAHLATGWATSHRPQLREYIARANRSIGGTE